MLMLANNRLPGEVRTSEREVLAALGQTNLPAALEPLDYVLS